MKTLLERFNEMAERSKALKAARVNDKKCCDAACAAEGKACEAKSVTEKVTAEAAMKDGFVDLIQTVLESFIGVNDPKDMDAAIRAAATKLSERMVANATAPKASDAFDVEAVRAAADDAINAALKNVRYESTSEDHKTEKFVWYKVTSAGIINAFAYDKELLTGIKVGKASA